MSRFNVANGFSARGPCEALAQAGTSRPSLVARGRFACSAESALARSRQQHQAADDDGRDAGPYRHVDGFLFLHLQRQRTDAGAVRVLCEREAAVAQARVEERQLAQTRRETDDAGSGVSDATGCSQRHSALWGATGGVAASGAR